MPPPEDEVHKTQRQHSNINHNTPVHGVKSWFGRRREEDHHIREKQKRQGEEINGKPPATKLEMRFQERLATYSLESYTTDGHEVACEDSAETKGGHLVEGDRAADIDQREETADGYRENNCIHWDFPSGGNLKGSAED